MQNTGLLTSPSRDPAEAQAVIQVQGLDVRVLDTGFAIHLQPPGVSKGAAMRELAVEMGIPTSEILAIGDSENDIEMLEAAGVGVAVANATPATRMAADVVTSRPHGDGFVEAVKMHYSDLFSR